MKPARQRWELWGQGTLAVAALLSVLACDAKPQRPREADSAGLKPAAAASPSESAVGGRASSAPPVPPRDRGPFDHRFPGAERIVAIGDLHGDISATKQVLSLAGALGESGDWVGGELVVVQTGDQLDRGDDERGILDLLESLAAQAQDAGGRLIVLNGNHETMNALGDFRYVTPGALGDFEGLQPRSKYAQRAPEPYQDRAQAFLPGGAMALRLAERPVIAQVGETLFVHGGLLPEHVEYGIPRINREVSAFLRGGATPPKAMTDPEGPLWTRAYGEGTLPAHVCSALDRVLQATGARRLVIGHTVQQEGISSACGERVFRIDVGLSSYYGGREVQALEIRPGGVRILSAPKK